MEKAVHYTMFRDTSRVVCEESIPIKLDGDAPQRVVSADGYDVIYRVPGAWQGKSLVRVDSFRHRQLLTRLQDYVSDLCDEWGHIAKIRTSVANDNKGRYKKRRGGLMGTTRLCTLWHAIGHKVRGHEMREACIHPYVVVRRSYTGVRHATHR